VIKDKILQVINSEVMWCKKNTDNLVTEEFKKGFIAGLEQARYLVTCTHDDD
jgi:hypothetical protein